MARRTNAELLEENRTLKKALEDRDSELISFATYQRDFENHERTSCYNTIDGPTIA